jgi:hypothetical protein
MQQVNNISNKVPPVKLMIDVAVQATVDNPPPALTNEERKRRQQVLYDAELHRVKKEWPYELIRQVESTADTYKRECMEVRPRVQQALKDVIGQRVIN